jgi:hypothetical protein
MTHRACRQETRSNSHLSLIFAYHGSFLTQSRSGQSFATTFRLLSPPSRAKVVMASDIAH